LTTIVNSFFSVFSFSVFQFFSFSVFTFLVFSFSVHVLSALFGPARARELYVLDGELVVVGELLARADLLHGKDDDVLLAKNVHNLGVAVGLKESWE
jgi:hypothetical protein